MDSPRSSASAPLLVVAILVALLVAYGAAFYLCGSVGTGPGTMRLHCYESRWLAILFTPAAEVESLILGQEVCAVYPVEP